MRNGLVLGGGGVVGIAWEIGVLAGLQRAGALDPAAMDAIVGTSAGSVVGSRLALGHDLQDLVAEQRATPAPPPAGSDDADARPRGDMRVVIEIFGELRKAATVTTEVTKIVGQKAMAAPTPPEGRWIASFETTLGGAGITWPAGRDLRIAAVDCHTGERRMWTRADADLVPLATAVASSCAVPGMFPTVGIGDSRYTDGGVWSITNADVLLDDRPEAVLIVAPTAVAAPGRRTSIEVEGDQLAAAGVRVARITPGPRFVSEVGPMNLMNPAMRAVGLEIGLADGASAAEAVQAAIAQA
jgi:NTE family protein